MGETREKVINITHGSGRSEVCTCLGRSPSGSATSAAAGRLRRVGAAVLVIGAAVMLCASVAALYLWKASDKSVYNVRYSANMDGQAREGSVEMDSDNNLERFKTGNGAGEAVEARDFQTGITGIRFVGGDKCYIKSQIKASLPHMGAHNKESLMFDLTDELTPVRPDGVLLWAAGEQPLKDTSFLSNGILGLCRGLPIYWLRPISPKDGERSRRGARRARRQLRAEEYEAAVEEEEEEEEEERDPVSHAEDDTSRVAEQQEGGQSSAGSAYNPENPHHRSGGAGDEGAVTFDPALDHRGICCSQCRRGYTHCQRICEPLRGHWPWPYNFRGCQVACRVIMPCRWWVARFLGAV